MHLLGAHSRAPPANSRPPRARRRTSRPVGLCEMGFASRATRRGTQECGSADPLRERVTLECGIHRTRSRAQTPLGPRSPPSCSPFLDSPLVSVGPLSPRHSLAYLPDPGARGNCSLPLLCLFVLASVHLSPTQACRRRRHRVTSHAQSGPRRSLAPDPSATRSAPWSGPGSHTPRPGSGARPTRASRSCRPPRRVSSERGGRGEGAGLLAPSVNSQGPARPSQSAEAVAPGPVTLKKRRDENRSHPFKKNTENMDTHETLPSLELTLHAGPKR